MKVQSLQNALGLKGTSKESIHNLSIEATKSIKSKKPLKIVLFNDGVHHVLDVADIIMIQSQSNYSMFFLTNGKKILTSKTLKHWQSLITPSDLIRTHNSYIVNKYHIIQIINKTKSLILEKGCIAKISRSVGKNILNF
jgi:two-component system, LytTR family, response regulator